MDIESEASKFDDLVEKIGSVFRQFPYCAECRLAILGLSDLDDLSEAMEDLTDSFGSDACDFAFRVVQAKWRPNTFANETADRIITITDYKSEEEKLDAFSLLYYNAKTFRGELSVEADKFPLSPIVEKALTCTLQKNEQLKRETRGIGFVSCLRINNLLSNPLVRELLDRFTLSGLFSKLVLCAYVFQYSGYNQPVDGDVSEEDIERVLRILQEGPVKQLHCYAGSVPVEFTRGLVDILKNGRICRLHLSSVTWNDEDVSARHLCTGLEAYKESLKAQKDGLGGPGLEIVKLIDYSRLPGWRKGNICSIIQALGGTATLRRLHLNLNGDSITAHSVLKVLNNDVLLHPECKLAELSIKGKAIGAVDCYGSDARLTQFGEAIAHCSSIRALTIFCAPFGLSKLSALLDHMASPGCRIEQCNVDRIGLVDHSVDLAAVAQSFENTNPHQSQPSRLRRISSRRLGTVIRKEREERSLLDLQRILTLFSDKLPYLISYEPFSYYTFRHNCPWELQISAKADIIHQIGLWQERNLCGRALLLATVAPTVPPGFWPTVLETVTRKTSILTDKSPPVDGIYYLVQGLIACNLIGGDSPGPAEVTTRESTDLVPHPPEEEEGSSPKRRRKI